ncbi:YitT family protein [Candidatus Phytoplasma prunorum]|uniref:YitT family protein n=1 Tax=Candidatus Phytoplasma prunorum TaxID=47565 RepID=UPI002FF1FF91
MKINFYKWVFIFINIFILAIGINLFSFESDFVNGGIDGLCIVLGKLFPQQITNTPGFSYNYNSYVILNILALILCFFRESKTVFLKTCLIVFILIFNLKFFSYLQHKEAIIFKLNEKINIFYFFKFINDDYFKFFTDHKTNKFLHASIFGGIIFGYTLAQIRKYGYTTGGMDIYQKFLKEKIKLSFTSILFLTDGVLIFLAFLNDFINDQIKNHILIHIFNRVFLPLVSLLIIGFIMNKVLLKSKNS